MASSTGAAAIVASAQTLVRGLLTTQPSRLVLAPDHLVGPKSDLGGFRSSLHLLLMQLLSTLSSTRSAADATPDWSGL